METARAQLTQASSKARTLLADNATLANEKLYQPGSKLYSGYAQSYPLATAAATLLALLSFFPLLLFGTFTVCTLVTLFLSSLAFAAFWSFILISLAFGVLSLALIGAAIGAGAGMAALCGALATWHFFEVLRDAPSLPEGTRTFLQDLATLDILPSQYAAKKPLGAPVNGVQYEPDSKPKLS